MMTIDRIIDRCEKWAVRFVVLVAQLVMRRVAVNVAKVPNARFSGFTLVIPFLALVAIPLLVTDLVTLNIWVFDYSLPLDTSLRWVYGHVPHIDYPTPIGISYWLLQGFATDLIGIDARTPIIANFLGAAIIAVGAVVLLRPRLSGGIFGLAILACLLLVISARAPGDTPAQISFLAAYNKIGLAILAVILIGMFVEPTARQSPAAKILESLILAFFLLWLIYLKVTFVPLAFAGAVAALHYAPRNRRIIAFGTALTLLGCGVVGGLTEINSAYLQDLADAAGSGSLIRWGKIILDVNNSRIAVVVFVIALTLYWRASAENQSDKITNIVVSLGLFLAGVVAMNQIHDNYLALTFVSLIVLTQRNLNEIHASDRADRTSSLMPPLMGATILIMLAMLSDAITSAYYFSTARQVKIGEPIGSLCADPKVPICRVVYQAFDKSLDDRIKPLPSPEFVGAVQEQTDGALLSLNGMNEFCRAHEDCVFWMVEQQLYLLLNRHMTREDRPLFLGFTNVLPYAYGVEPPKHVPAWMGVGRNISVDSHPEPAHLFSDVTLLVVPKVDFGIGRLPELSEIYEPDIPSYFRLVETTDSWEIWRKS